MAGEEIIFGRQKQHFKQESEMKAAYKARVLEKARELAGQGKPFYARDIDPISPQSAGLILHHHYQELGLCKHVRTGGTVYLTRDTLDKIRYGNER